jgi:outer membrane protein assembly factor BamB
VSTISQLRSIHASFRGFALVCVCVLAVVGGEGVFSRLTPSPSPLSTGERGVIATGPLFAVIPTFVLVGPLAVLAALFPVVFAGLAVWLRRWLALFTVASLGSTIYLVLSWCQPFLSAPWNTPAVRWLLLSAVAACGGVWSWRRHRANPKQHAASRPAAETMALGLLVLLGIGLTGAALPRKVDTAWRVLWTFQPPEHGAIISSPVVAGDRVYVAALRTTGLSSSGVLYCLDRVTGEEIWRFDDDGDMQQVFSTPCLADGQLFVGEGLHENQACRFYCIDAATGKKLWQFETQSHLESSPCVADGKVFTGAGDDGVYCFHAGTGAVVWHNDWPGHVDAGPVVIGGRLYVGSGVSRTRKTTNIVCIAADTGKEIWRKATDLPAWGSPVVDGEQVYVGLGNGRFDQSAQAPEKPAGAMLCLDAETGDVRWRYNVGDAVLARPAIDDKHVYFAGRDHQAYCLKRGTGELVWAQDLGSPIVASPALRDGRLYMATSVGQVCRLHPDAGQVLGELDLAQWSKKWVRVYSTPAVIADSPSAPQQVLVGASLDDGLVTSAALYCIEAP